MRWQNAAGFVATAAANTLNALNSAEEIYQELLEIYNYSGATDQLMADLLFADVIAAEARNPAVATVEEVAKVTDVRLAIQALHDLHLALDNNALTADDRGTKLRRMS
jgi:hypothetical protein